MIAANDDGAFQLARAHQGVETQAQPGAFAVAEPADAGGQALEMYLLAGQPHPTRQRFVSWKLLQYGLIGAIDVLRITGKGDPPEGAAAFAELGPNVLRHEAGNVKSIGDTGFDRLG